MNSAFLHFGVGREPRQTVQVEARVSESRGLKSSATAYQVKWGGRWRRVMRDATGAYLGRPGNVFCRVQIGD